MELRPSDKLLNEISLRPVKLPALYQNAITALKECNNLDECKEWKDKMEALATYWSQANDETLAKLAQRIKLRAFRRAGELLKQYDARGQHMKKDASVHSLSQKEVAEQVGFSERQSKTAVRLAKIPEGEFNEKVDSDKPPSVKELTRNMDPKDREILFGEKPRGFAKAIHVAGFFELLVKELDRYDPFFIIEGMDKRQIEEVKKYISTIEKWCDIFMVNVP